MNLRPVATLKRFIKHISFAQNGNFSKASNIFQAEKRQMNKMLLSAQVLLNVGDQAQKQLVTETHTSDQITPAILP
jgi:hypothetical protein